LRNLRQNIWACFDLALKDTEESDKRTIKYCLLNAIPELEINLVYLDLLLINNSIRNKQRFNNVIELLTNK